MFSLTGETAESFRGNRAYLDRADMLIGVFWTRLSTPADKTETETVERIPRYIEAGKPVLLYFSTKTAASNLVSPRQLAELRHARTTFEREGVVRPFATEEEFRRTVISSLTEKLTQFLM